LPRYNYNYSSTFYTMPSHLRNGKDLSFEQQRAAKRAQQLYQQAPEPPSTAGLQRVDKQPSSVEHQQTVEHPSAVGKSPPSAYTLSPAALERLRQSQEQALVDGADQYRLVGNGSNLPARDLQRAEIQHAQQGVDEFENFNVAAAPSQALNLGHQVSQASFKRPSTGVRQLSSLSFVALESLHRS
jgi:hypothetical protein